MTRNMLIWLIKNKFILIVFFYCLINSLSAQNLLPNCGFEKYNIAIDDEVDPLGNPSFTTRKSNIIDSCIIFSNIGAVYYNKLRIKEHTYDNRLNNLKIIHYRGRSCVQLDSYITGSSGGIAFNVRKPLVKDSMYTVECYTYFDWGDSIIPSMINCAYSNNIAKGNVEFNKFVLNFPVNNDENKILNNKECVKITFSFKAKENATYFYLFSDFRKISKRGGSVSIDNVSLFKEHDKNRVLNLSKFEKLPVFKRFDGIFNPKDTTFNQERFLEIKNYLRRKDYFITIEMGNKEIDKLRKKILEQTFQKLDYDELRIKYVNYDSIKLRENINIVLY